MREPTREHQYEKVLCVLLAQYRALQKDVRELRASVDALEVSQAAHALALDTDNMDVEEEDDAVAEALDGLFDLDRRQN